MLLRIKFGKEAIQIEIEDKIRNRDNQIKTLSRKIGTFEQLKFRVDKCEEKLWQLYDVVIIDCKGNLVEKSERVSFKYSLVCKA